MNKTALGRLAIVILVAFASVFVPYFVGDVTMPIDASGRDALWKIWFCGFGLIGGFAIVILVVGRIIMYVKEG